MPFSTAAERSALALSVSPAPVIPSTITWTTSNIPATTIVSFHILSFGQISPPVDLSIIGIIGIILLIGIVKKNAIMMIDFALDAERNEGKSPREAIYQACLLRFRPIMMTTMAALLGAVPLAIGTGVGSELRRPLGITIIGGLIFSQVLTLYTTPVIYLWFDWIAHWGRKRQPAETKST